MPDASNLRRRTACEPGRVSPVQQCVQQPERLSSSGRGEIRPATSGNDPYRPLWLEFASRGSPDLACAATRSASCRSSPIAPLPVGQERRFRSLVEVVAVPSAMPLCEAVPQKRAPLHKRVSAALPDDTHHRARSGNALPAGYAAPERLQK
jgi:hypothetical protein